MRREEEEVGQFSTLGIRRRLYKSNLRASQFTPNALTCPASLVSTPNPWAVEVCDRTLSPSEGCPPGARGTEGVVLRVRARRGRCRVLVLGCQLSCSARWAVESRRHRTSHSIAKELNETILIYCVYLYNFSIPSSIPSSTARRPPPIDHCRPVHSICTM